MQVPRDLPALAVRAAAWIAAGSCFVCGSADTTEGQRAVACRLHGIGLGYKVCDRHEGRHRWPADIQDLPDWMLHNGWGSSLAVFEGLDPERMVGYSVHSERHEEPHLEASAYQGIDADARVSSAWVQQGVCFVCGGSPIVAHRLLRCFTHGVGDLLPVCGDHHRSETWPPRAHALINWMIHNGFGRPINSIVAPSAGQMVGAEAGEDDIYFIPNEPEKVGWRQRLSRWLTARRRFVGLRWIPSLLAGLTLVGGIFFSAWAFISAQSQWLVATAAAIQAATAIVIVLLTHRLADTAADALRTSDAQAAAMFQANLDARVQRETDAMPVLDPATPSVRLTEDDQLEIGIAVHNRSPHPALTVDVTLARGPWNWNWEQPPHLWVQANAIQRTDHVGVLPPDATNEFVLSITREWAASIYTVRVDASGLFGGRLMQTWEMELGQGGVTSWRQLEVFVRPHTAGVAGIQHRTAVG